MADQLQQQSQVEALGETLIPVINRLQDIFSQVQSDFKLELPQVAVVGSQSAGKSSVLESLVGKDFLPRGPDICTRRPLVLQLVRSKRSGSEDGAEEWGEFLHLKGQRFDSFQEIRQEIENETNRMVGDASKNVSDRPIRLKIVSPNVLTMTLVDLPGIAKNPVGDQPTDIESRIRQMVYKYIKVPSCIILAVSAANVDLANSDAIHMAQSVDPEGIRTIGVLTKLDIMDHGTNAVDILRNKKYPLRLGYIGVVNRSQMDINKNTPLDKARKMEAAYFSQHTDYHEVAALCGIANLARRLNIILVEHIRTILPDLRAAIEDARVQRKAELARYGGENAGANTTTARATWLLQIISEYSEKFAVTLDGKSDSLSVQELSGGARIRWLFQEEFVKGTMKLQPASELSDEQIYTTIKNSSGVQGSLLIPIEPFEVLVRRSILRLMPLGLECKDRVESELFRIAALVVPQDVHRFPALHRGLRQAVEEFIHQGSEPAGKMIENFVNCEHAYINLDNPSFIGGHKALRKTMEERRKERDDIIMSNTANADGATANGNTNRGKNTNSQNKSADANALSKVGLQVIQEDGNNDDNNENESTTGGAGGWFSFLRQDQRSQTAPAGLDTQQNVIESQLIPSPKPVQQNDQILVDVTRKLVGSYFDVVRRNMQDMVPKAIMHFLVMHCKKGLQNHLIHTLYKDDLIDNLMKEREDIAAKRANAKAALVALDQAMKELDTIPNELTKRVQLENGNSGSLMDDVQEFSNYSGNMYRNTPRMGGTSSISKDRSAAARMAMQAAQAAQGIASPEEVFGFDNVGDEE
eukprot:TRINITY_DN5525_c0_g1_i1.p1 TRINITY_DN5525_c0_g1~~TRINITY_DN5525_c0_g1_i1.p1  ORF type:complete len:875 (+),score=94.34 TRINITY_DN5525_c0_g1_i1:191-2626(+)